MRCVRFKMSGELLRTVLKMPGNTQFVEATVVRELAVGIDIVEFVVWSPDVPEADEPHYCVPTFYSHRVEWDWNIDQARAREESEHGNG